MHRIPSAFPDHQYLWEHLEKSQEVGHLPSQCRVLCQRSRVQGSDREKQWAGLKAMLQAPSSCTNSRGLDLPISGRGVGATTSALTGSQA